MLMIFVIRLRKNSIFSVLGSTVIDVRVAVNFESHSERKNLNNCLRPAIRYHFLNYLNHLK
jgi:hypothetical protein